MDHEARLLEIRAECFADDIAMPDLNVASSWTDEEAREFFESGGACVDVVRVPDISADPAALAAVLTEVDLTHLSPLLANDGLCTLAAMERGALLSLLKDRGVEKLSDRQKAATAVLKAGKRNNGKLGAGAPSPPPPPTPPPQLPPTAAVADGSPSKPLAPSPSLPSLPSPSLPVAPSTSAGGGIDAANATLLQGTVATSDEALTSLLEQLSLSHLSTSLAEASLQSLSMLGRAALLTALKASGVDKLVERQKLATAIAKARTAGATALRPTGSAAPQPPMPPRPRASSMESPGAAHMERRTKVAVLPPQIKLSTEELRQKVPLVRPGEWYQLPFPTTLAQLTADEFGAMWLTRAFHAAGSMSADDAVSAIVSVHVLELQVRCLRRCPCAPRTPPRTGVRGRARPCAEAHGLTHMRSHTISRCLAPQGIEAQGGAGEKAIITVAYAKPDNGLHTTLFVKSPWRLEVATPTRMLAPDPACT